MKNLANSKSINPGKIKKPRIKICGMREYENISQLVLLPVDYIGFIFYPPSPRYVGMKIEPSVLNIIPPHIQKVGVFVNSPLKEVLKIAGENRLECIQLHGNEIPDYCKEILKSGYTVIKAFKAEPEMLICETAKYQSACHYFLFDTPSQQYGGSGQKFNWDILNRQKLSLPYFLSGGIAPGDEEIIKNMDLQGLHAIDINSRFEIKPGIKNIELIKKFINNLT